MFADPVSLILSSARRIEWILFLLYLFVCICKHVHVCVRAYVNVTVNVCSENNLQELPLSFHHVGSRIELGSSELAPRASTMSSLTRT